MTDNKEIEIPAPPDPAELRERARLFSELDATLDSNIKEAEFLAGEAVATLRLPLVSARWSKPQLESNIRNTRKIQTGGEMTQVTARLTGLALMTDQAVAAVLSPALLLWEAEPVTGGRKLGRYLDMAAREWNLIFKDNINNSLDKEYVKGIHNFLQGQHQTLVKFGDQKTSSNFWYHLNRSEMCDRFFGAFSIRKTLDGRDNRFFSEQRTIPNLGSPFTTHKKTPSKSPFIKTAHNNNSIKTAAPSSRPTVEFGSCSVGQTNTVFGPSKDDFESDSEIIPLHGFLIGSYSIAGHGNKPVCKIGSDFISLSWAPHNQLFLTAKDLNAVILSPETSHSPPLFLFLSLAGCLKVLKISQTVKQIPHTSFSTKSPSNQKKIVLNLRDSNLKVRESLRRSFEKSMNTRYCEVIPTFGRLLSFGIVDYERAFTDPFVRVMPIMKTLNHEDGEDGSSFNEEGSGTESRRSPASNNCDEDEYLRKRVKRIVNEKIVSSIVNDLLASIEGNSERRNIVKSIVDKMVDEVPVTSALKRKHSSTPISTKIILKDPGHRVSKTLVNQDFDNLKEGEHMEVWIYVNGSWIRIDMKVSKTRDSFVEANIQRLKKHHPSLFKIHAQLLKYSWKCLKKYPKAKCYDISRNFPELYHEEPVAKKPKIIAAPIIVDPKSITATNNNLDPSSPICEKDKKVSIPYKHSPPDSENKASASQILEEKDRVIDLTKSKSDSGCCDDCRYVTKKHKVRILTGKYKCKCHPCVLRQNTLRLGRTDPYKVIKISEFRGPGDYWSQPWLVDLYEDIIKGSSGLTHEKILEMTGTNETMRRFRIYENKKKVLEEAVKLAQSSQS